jgi:hypothetical protein
VGGGRSLRSGRNRSPRCGRFSTLGRGRPTTCSRFWSLDRGRSAQVPADRCRYAEDRDRRGRHRAALWSARYKTQANLVPVSRNPRRPRSAIHLQPRRFSILQLVLFADRRWSYAGLGAGRVPAAISGVAPLTPSAGAPRRLFDPSLAASSDKEGLTEPFQTGPSLVKCCCESPKTLTPTSPIGWEREYRIPRLSCGDGQFQHEIVGLSSQIRSPQVVHFAPATCGQESRKQRFPVLPRLER